MLKTVVPLMEGITGIATGIFKWMEAHPVLTRIGATMAVVATVGSLLGGMLLFVGGSLLHLGGMALMVPARLGQIAFSMGVTQSAAVPLIVSLKALGLAALKLAIPFALVGVAVFGLVKAWDTNFLGFRDTVEEVWFAIKSGAIAVWGGIQRLFGGVVALLGTAGERVRAFFSGWSEHTSGAIAPLLLFAGAVAWGLGFMAGTLVRAWNLVKANPIVSGLLFASLVAFTWPLLASAATAVWGFATQTVLAGARAAGGFLVARVAAMRAALAYAWANRSALLFRLTTYTVVAATKAWAGVQWALNAAMAANPVGLVIGLVFGLAAAAVYAYKRFDWFRNFLNGMWDGFLGMLNTVIGGLNDLIKIANRIPGIEIPMIPTIAGGPALEGVGAGAPSTLGEAFQSGLAQSAGELPGAARTLPITPSAAGTTVSNGPVDRSVHVAEIKVVSGPNTPAKSIREQLVEALREAAGEEDGLEGASYA